MSTTPEPYGGDHHTDPQGISAVNVWAVASAVFQDRQRAYGPPGPMFTMIARLWSAAVGSCITVHDVAIMLALLKIARAQAGTKSTTDSYVDIINYVAIANDFKGSKSLRNYEEES